ncbi:RagB/SusD family nutrient uptake outer membrane protein [Chitinophaga solisilvae]|uniref:RagB/SusD family nutrient uptake outer membrane protein n=1 Tax=Chitinophaga solisilvae TaxID=1233460 RepID=UPI001368CCB0|nr:RagB/SusD family nutrient uptake outer membrane protein [Chitinophaga solisilvae]
MKKLLTVLAISTGLSACSGMLDIKPADQIDESKIFSSLQTFDKAVLGVYAGWNAELSMRTGSVMADECRIGPKNAGVNGSAQHLFRWTYAASDAEITDPWSNAYQVINRVNRLLAGIDKVPAADEAAVAARQQLKGELTAIRAYAHFELFRHFGASGVYHADALAVPYVTAADIDNKPGRPTYADFFREMNADIAHAAAWIDDSRETTRMHLQAVQALQARVALYTRNWALAAESAGKVIAQVPLATMQEFPGIWTDQSGAEVIFKLKRTAGSTLRPGDVWKNATLGIVYFAPSLKLLRAYDAENDIRYTSYFSYDSTLAASGQPGEVIRKYAGTPGAENLNDVKIFRTGEMYLIRAEALLEQGNTGGAAADLQTLREHRIQGYTPQINKDARQLREEIMLERFRELPFEGHRYFDRKRLGLPLTRLPEDAADTALQPGELFYYLPIPQAERMSNPNIRPDNPGW